MLKEERLKKILEYLKEHNYATNDQISNFFNIPFTTLRRDLSILQEEGKLKRVHGGAKLLLEKSIFEDKFENKLASNIEAKQIIAQKALNCIKPHETIFLDSGSTTYYLSKLLKPGFNNKIYTNSIVNAQLLIKNNIKDVNVLPGKLLSSTLALCGIETLTSLSKYNFDLAFIGINAIDGEYNFYTTNEDEAEVKKMVIKNSQFVFGLADTSKNNSKSLVKFSDKSQIVLINELD